MIVAIKKKICISLTELFASFNYTSLLSEVPITNRRERDLPTNKTDYGDFLKVETHINISSHYCLPAHPYSLTVCRVNFGHKRNECVRLSRLSSVAGAGVFVAIFNVTGDLPLKYHCTWKLYYICNFCSSIHFLTQFKLYLRKRSYNYSFK